MNEGALDNATLISQLSSQFSLKGHPDYVNDIKIVVEYSQNACDQLPHLIGGRLAVDRTELSLQLMEKLEQHHLLVMLGESGSGKSVMAKSIAEKNFAVKTIWLDSYLLESQNLSEATTKLNIVHQWPDLIAHLPFRNQNSIKSQSNAECLPSTI